MSSRFDNLIKLVVDKFQYDEYTLLLNEALNLNQVQDQLKAKGVDLDEYNPKHYLFLLALLNSNLNLDIYNQIITNIKDQGILNRLMSQTVDRRSNNPTVDSDIINRVLQNTSNIPELNAILNSISQNRDKSISTEPKEYKEGQSPAERYLAAAKKMVSEFLTKQDNNTNEHEVNTLLKKFSDIVEPWKQKAPNDRLLQNNVYLLGVIYMVLNTQNAVSDFNKIKKVFDMYMSYPEISEKNVLFNDPYKNDFYKFSSYVYKFITKKAMDSDKSDNPEHGDPLVYEDDDIRVFKGTVEDHQESIRRCIKYGKGSQHGLCISSKSDNLYTRYRMEGENLTTYFVYLKTPELIKKYGAHGNIDFFLIDTLTDDYDDNVHYQYNKVSPNSEVRVPVSDLIKKYPILKKAINDDAFKVLRVSEKERKLHGHTSKRYNDHLEVDTVEKAISYTRLHASEIRVGHQIIGHFAKQFPEVIEYLLEILIDDGKDTFKDLVNNGHDYLDYDEKTKLFKKSNSYEQYIIHPNFEPFLKEYTKYYPLFTEELQNAFVKNCEAYIKARNKIVSLILWNQIKEEHPDSLNYLINFYIKEKTKEIIKIANRYGNDRQFQRYFKYLIEFLKEQNIIDKYKDGLQNAKKEDICNLGRRNEFIDDEKFEKIKDEYPEYAKDILKTYLDHKIHFYYLGEIDPQEAMQITRRNHLTNSDPEHAIFTRLPETLKLYPDLKNEYLKVSKEMKLYVAGHRIGGTYLDENYFEDVKNRFPDILQECIDIYIKDLLYDNKLQVDKDEAADHNFDDEYDGYEPKSDRNMIYDKVYGGLWVIHNFYKNNEGLFEKHRKEIIENKFYILNKLRTFDLIDSGFFYAFQDFYPELLSKFIHDYINKKVNDIKNTIKEDPDKEDELGDLNSLEFILQPIHDFHTKNEDLFSQYTMTKQDLDIEYIKNALANSRYYSQGYNNRRFSSRMVVNKLENNSNFNENPYKVLNDLIKETEENYPNRLPKIYIYFKLFDIITSLITSRGIGINIASSLKSLILVRKNKIIEAISLDFSSFITDQMTDIDKRSDDDNNNLLRILCDKKSEGNHSHYFHMIHEFIPDLINRVLKNLIVHLPSKLKVLNEDKYKLTFRRINSTIFNNKKVSDFIQEKNLGKLLFNLIESCGFIDDNNEKIKSIFASSDEDDIHFLKNFIKFISKYIDIKQTIIYRILSRKDKITNIDLIRNLKTGSEEVTIDGETYYKNFNLYGLPTIRFYFDPPDLSKFILKSNNSKTVNIDANSFNTLKWLPKSLIDSTLIISGNLSNIDYLPEGLNTLRFSYVNTPEKLHIENDVNINNIKQISFSNVNGLKTIQNFNIFKNIKEVWVDSMPDLESLNGISKAQEIHLSNLPKIKNLQTLNIKKISKFVCMDMTFENCLGMPIADNYNFLGCTFYSFKGFPKNVNGILNFSLNPNYESNSDMCKSLFPANKYKDFPEYVNTLFVTEKLQKCFFGKIELPRLGGKSKLSWIQTANRDPEMYKAFIGAYDRYVNRIRKKTDKQYAIARRLKKAQKNRIPTKRDELEAIEAQQDKIANREKIKRLSKEELELITPFNVLLEDMLNTIKTSFKVYK